mmetsp:Transcript_58931/g.104245  ORF Transcript_58931/g.104245 Transcript_58931/m.104245 type:complete len:87 (+) Transcript_58931:210-470(+)
MHAQTPLSADNVQTKSEMECNSSSCGANQVPDRGYTRREQLCESTSQSSTEWSPEGIERLHLNPLISEKLYLTSMRNASHQSSTAR